MRGKSLLQLFLCLQIQAIAFDEKEMI